MGQAQRHAAGGRRQSWPSDVHENGTAPTPNSRTIVVAEHYNHIVEMVVAPQALGTARIRAAHKPVIIAVGRIVAPTVTHAQRPQW